MAVVTVVAAKMESGRAPPTGWVGPHLFIRESLFTGLACDIGAMLTLIVQKDLVHGGKVKGE